MASDAANINSIAASAKPLRCRASMDRPRCRSQES
jgi:hypothetical protein